MRSNTIISLFRGFGRDGVGGDGMMVKVIIFHDGEYYFEEGRVKSMILVQEFGGGERSNTIISLVRGFRGDGVGGSIFNRSEDLVEDGAIAVELQHLGGHLWKMIHLLVNVVMEGGYGTTGPTYEHHNQQN